MEKFEMQGIWWLPDDSENYLTGILKFNSENGANLELIGRLSDFEEYETKIILGKTSDGKNITLYKCFEINSTISSPGFPTTKIYASIIFEGVHFNSEEDIRFKEISCRYTNLDEWAWMRGIQIDIPTTNKLEISYSLPSKVGAKIEDGYEIEIYPETKLPSLRLVEKESSIIQKIYVKLINSELNSFDEHLHKLQHMKNFISFGVGEPVTIIDLFGETEVNRETYEGNIYFPKVKIYFSVKKSSEEYKAIIPSFMLFNLSYIKDDFSDFINRWFDRYEMLNPVFNLYFGMLYNPDMYIEQKFQSLIHAIESLHRRTRKNNEIEQVEHEKRITTILESVDEEQKKWLEGKLAYSNEPTLRNRLRELLTESATILKLTSRNKKDSFICKVCDTRNYFTHYDTSLASRAALGEELISICARLKIIIEFNLLIEIGFCKQKSQEMLEKRYKQYTLFDE